MKVQNIVRTLAVASLMLSFGVSSSYAKKKGPQPSKLSGKVLYQNNCLSCHQKNGKGAGPFPSLVRDGLDVYRILLKMDQGKYRAKNPALYAAMKATLANIHPKDYKKIAAYIKTLKKVATKK